MLDLLPSPCGSSAFASFSGKASSVHSVARLVFFLFHGFRSPFLRFLSWLVTFVTWMSFLLFFLLSLFGFQGAPAASFAAMGLSGLEPPTSRLSGVRSNRLSYKPKALSFRPAYFFKIIWQPPALPCRLQHSTIGRLWLNLRVRDGYAPPVTPWESEMPEVSDPTARRELPKAGRMTGVKS